MMMLECKAGFVVGPTCTIGTVLQLRATDAEMLTPVSGHYRDAAWTELNIMLLKRIRSRAALLPSTHTAAGDEAEQLQAEGKHEGP